MDEWNVSERDGIGVGDDHLADSVIIESLNRINGRGREGGDGSSNNGGVTGSSDVCVDNGTNVVTTEDGNDDDILGCDGLSWVAVLEVAAGSAWPLG